MDVTQIPLKINQTILSDGAKLNAKLEPKLNSFFNILYGQFLKSTPEAASDINTEATPEGEIQANQQLTEENWQELETILVEVLSIFKEMKSLIGTSAEQMNPLTTSDEPQLYVNPSFKNLHQNEVDQLENRTMKIDFRQPLEGSLELNKMLAETKDSKSISLTPGEQGKLPLFNTIPTAPMPSYLNVREDRLSNLEKVGPTPSLQQPTEEWSRSLFGKVTANIGVGELSDEAGIGTPLSRKEVDFPHSNEIRTSEPLPSVFNKLPNRVEEFGQPVVMRPQAVEGTQGFPVKNDFNIGANLKGISSGAVNIFTTNDVQTFENVVEKEIDPVFQQRGEMERPGKESKIVSTADVAPVSEGKIPITKEAELSKNSAFSTGENSKVEKSVYYHFQPPADEEVPVRFTSASKEQTITLGSEKITIPRATENQNPEQFSYKNVEIENRVVNPPEKVDAQQVSYKNVETEKRVVNQQEKVDAPKRNHLPFSMTAQQDRVQQSEGNSGTDSRLQNHLDVELGLNRVETNANRSVDLPENDTVPESKHGRITSSTSLLNGNDQRIGLEANSETLSITRHPQQPFVPRLTQAERAPMVNRATSFDQEPVNYAVRQTDTDSGHEVFTAETPPLSNGLEGIEGQLEMKTMNSNERPSTEERLELSRRPVTNGMSLHKPEQDGGNLHSIGNRNVPSTNQINEQSNRIQTPENVSNVNLEPDQVEKPQRYINLGFEQSKETSPEIIGRTVVNEGTGKTQGEASTSLKTSEKLVLPTREEANSLESAMSLSPDDSMVESKETLKTSKSMQQTNEESQVELADFLRPVRTAINELQSLASLAEQEGAIRSEKSTFVQNAVFNLQDNLVDALNQLGDWLQKLKGPSQASKLDFNQMMEDLVQVIAKQPIENQKNSQMPDKIKNNIQQLLDQLDFPIEGETLVKHPVSFDRNQIGGGATPRLGTLNIDEKRSHLPIHESKESLSTMVEPMNMAPQEVKHTDVVNHSKPIMPSPSIPVPEFAARLSEWIGRNSVMQNGKAGNAETRFLLNPEHLGPIEIKISFDEQGKLSAQILTDTGSAKEILETQLQQLKQHLQQQGIVVQKLDVTQQVQIQLQDSNQAGMMFYEDGSSSSHEHQNPQSNEKRSKSLSEAEQMELENDQEAFTYGGTSRKSSSQIDFTA